MSLVDMEGVKRKLLNTVQQEVLTEDGDFKLKLITLCTFMDRDGLLLVTTRINQRDDNQDFRYPIVLPSNHELVKRMVTDRHLQSSHVRVHVILNDLCQQFWILRGRK